MQQRVGEGGDERGRRLVRRILFCRCKTQPGDESAGPAVAPSSSNSITHTTAGDCISLHCESARVQCARDPPIMIINQ